MIAANSFTLSGMRKIIAERMKKSLDETAQLSFHTESDATNLLAQRMRLKSIDKTVSIEDMLIKLVSLTLNDLPQFNGCIANNTVELHTEHNINVAISIAGGLVAPTLRDVGSKSVEAISLERRELVAKAKSARLTPSEMREGTFTISNLGLRNIQFFTPIINRPQLAILGIGKITPRAALHTDGKVISRPMLGLSLTVDHRVIDGDPAGLFLSTLSDYVERAEF